MSNFNWFRSLLSIIISAGMPLVIFLARNWLKVSIEKGVTALISTWGKIAERASPKLRFSEERFTERLAREGSRDNHAP